MQYLAVRCTGNKCGLFMLKITLPRLQNEAVMRDYSQTVRRHAKLKYTVINKLKFCGFQGSE